MPRKRSALALLLLTSLPSAVHAGSAKMPSAPSVRDEIAQAIPEARFEVESRIRLGRVAMAFVKPVVRLVLDEDEEARAIIGAIKRVDVATYRVTDLPDSVDLAGFEVSRVA